MRANVTSLKLAAGLTLGLGAAFLHLGCAAEEPGFIGVHSTPTAPDPRWIPEDVVAQLRACAGELPAALPGERPEYLVGFDVQAGRSGKIDRVTLKRSTLGARGVEACMREVLSGMTLPLADLVPLLAAEGGKHPLSPEARRLLGGGPLLGSIALLPAVLTIAGITIVVAVVVYVSYEVVQAIDAYARSTTTVAAAAPSATTTATAAAATTTAPPDVKRGQCLPCLPVPVEGLGYDYHSAAAGDGPHWGMTEHTHHFRMNQSPPQKGCRCFWKRNFMHPTPGFSPLPGAVLVTGFAEGGGVVP